MPCFLVVPMETQSLSLPPTNASRRNFSGGRGCFWLSGEVKSPLAMPIFFLEGDYDMTLREHLNFQYGFLHGHFVFFQLLTVIQVRNPVRFSEKLFGTMQEPRVHSQIGCFWKCLLEETWSREQSFFLSRQCPPSRRAALCALRGCAFWWW